MGLASSQIGRGWQFLWHLWWAIRWWYAKYQHFVGKTHAKNRPVTKFVMSMSRKSCKTFSGSAASTRDKTVQSCIILHTTWSRYFFNSFYWQSKSLSAEIILSDHSDHFLIGSLSSGAAEVHGEMAPYLPRYIIASRLTYSLPPHGLNKNRVNKIRKYLFHIKQDFFYTTFINSKKFF